MAKTLRRRFGKLKNETKDYNLPIEKSYDDIKEYCAWDIDGDNPDLGIVHDEVIAEHKLKYGSDSDDEGPKEEKKDDKKEKKE